MAGIRRLVETRFWNDPKVIDTYSVEDKYFMLYLMTNPATTQLGIYPISKKVMSFESGYSPDVVSVLLERFENKYKCIIYSNETQELSLINSLTYTIMKGGKPVLDLMQKELTRVLDSNLIFQTYLHMRPYWNNSDRKIDLQVKEIFEVELTKRDIIINSLEHSNQNENQNDIEMQNDKQIHNQNHNQISYTKSHPDSLDESPPNSFMSYQLEKIQDYCINSIGKLSNSDIERIRGWLSFLTADRAIEALEMSKNKNNPIMYAQAIINNWL